MQLRPALVLRAVAALALAVTGLVAALAPSAGAATTSRPAPRVVALTPPLAARTAPGAPLTVWTEPRTTATSTTLPATTSFGTPRVVLADAHRGRWYRVSLPTRPNGSQGWVRARDVTLAALRDDVHVDLTARTLTWRHDGQVALETPIAIGAPDTPTPTGSFYVTDLLDNADDAGAYGPYALGLSAHSDTLSEFAGGDGQIGLHGTNAPDSIGQAVSHGCVRVPNDVVAVLAQRLPLGTPVVIG
jgi:lipoprotein-anchoring transpeptidase ErfK/SrfK